MNSPTTAPEAAEPQVFQSKLLYDAIRIHAAAVYCSDGRAGEHFDDFLMNGLRLPKYDRVALPGGPAAFAGAAPASLQREAAVDELRFLVDVHGLERIILIQHQGCAYYATRLGLSEPELERRQRADLVRAVEFVRSVTRVETIEGYFARIVERSMCFEPAATA